MQYRFRLTNANQHRHKDENGYITVDESPILKTGVLEYYGSELVDGSESPEIDGKKIDPDKVYRVYISEEELNKGADSFKLLPIVNGHEWLGQDGEDARDYQEGSTGEDVFVRDGFLYVPLKFTGNQIIEDLESHDKEELSASYTNLLTWADDQSEYDLVASDIKGNHVALVEKGRCGSDVRVLNQKMESKTMKTNNELKLIIDGKEVDLAKFFKQEEQEEAHADTEAIVDEEVKEEPREEEREDAENEESVDKRSLIDEIGGILKDHGLDDEIIRTVIGKAEKIAYEGSESSEADNELPDDEEDAFEGKDEDKEVENGCKSKNEDGEEEKEEDKKEDVASKVANAMARRDKNLQRAYNHACELIGAEFNPFGMSEREILVRALNHAGVSTDGKESVGELYAMVKVANSVAARVDNGFDYAGDGKDTVTINI